MMPSLPSQPYAPSSHCCAPPPDIATPPWTGSKIASRKGSQGTTQRGPSGPNGTQPPRTWSWPPSNRGSLWRTSSAPFWATTYQLQRSQGLLSRPDPQSPHLRDYAPPPLESSRNPFPHQHPLAHCAWPRPACEEAPGGGGAISGGGAQQ